MYLLLKINCQRPTVVILIRLPDQVLQVVEAVVLHFWAEDVNPRPPDYADFFGEKWNVMFIMTPAQSLLSHYCNTSDNYLCNPSKKGIQLIFIVFQVYHYQLQLLLLGN